MLDGNSRGSQEIWISLPLAVLHAVNSFVLESHFSSWAWNASWQAVALIYQLRQRHSPFRSTLSLFIIFEVVRLKSECYGIITSIPSSQWNYVWFTLLPVLALGTSLAFNGAFKSKETSTLEHDSLDGPFRPMILPCKTTHARIFPKRNAFGYSYLFVGIPVGWHGKAGSTLSADTQCISANAQSKGWFHVQAGDHLHRGDEDKDLKEKLQIYLESQGVSRTEWEFAYLTTAPRFLGYSFNPVSFWYIYSKDLTLRYMVLEVNNTFDERRMYLLKSPQAGDNSDSDAEVNDAPQKPKRFTNSWAKDFHVSPFNSRKGRYTLSAVDPLLPYMSNPMALKIDNTITLKSSKDHSKLVARVFSTSAPLDPVSLGTWQTVRFISAWWWVGFFTFPRIVKEAGKLFFKRKLHVWFRPEVEPSSLGRKATTEENAIAPYVIEYMKHTVMSHESPFTLTLNTGLPSIQPVTISSPSTPPEDSTTPHLTLSVLTPAFYSHFIHHHTLSSALETSALDPHPQNRTLHTSSPSLLATLFENSPKLLTSQSSSLLASLRWKILHQLRCAPPPPAYPAPGSLQPAAPDAGAAPRPKRDEAALDAFIRACFPADEADIYRRLATKMFLAARFTRGLVGVVDAVELVVRAGLVWGAVKGMGGTSWTQSGLSSSLLFAWEFLKG